MIVTGLLLGCDAAPEYVGELKDGKPEGHGTFAFSDGTKHVGDFKDGRFSAEIVGNRINISSLNLLMLDPL